MVLSLCYAPDREMQFKEDERFGSSLIINGFGRI